MKFLKTLFTALLFFGCLNSFAAERDAVKATLDQARASFETSKEDSQKAFLAAMDERIKELAEKGDLTAVKIARTQKELFESQGTLPTSPRLERPKVDYQREIRAAEVTFRRALEQAKADYTRALKVPEAEAIELELAQLKPAPGGQKGVPPSSTTSPAQLTPPRFVAPSTWIGTIQNQVPGKPAHTTPVKFEVFERDSISFKARYTIQGTGIGDQVRDIKGFIRGQSVGWYAKDVTALRGGEGIDFAGTYRGSKLVLSGKGLAQLGADRGKPITGLITLERKSD